MKATTRLLCLLLIGVMLLSAVACSGGNEIEDTTTATTTAAPIAETTESPYDQDGYLKSTLPDDLNFGNETITVLWWNDVEMPEFFTTEQNGDRINDSIYERNIKVEDKLGVKLAWQDIKGQFNDGVGAAYAQHVGNAYSAGDTTWDLMAAHTRTMALTSLNGYCANLLPLEYLDFDMPWWPKTMTETATIGDALYYVTGDVSTNTLHMMYTVFYNKKLIKDHKLDDPVALVRNGKWTNEEFQKLTKDVGFDVNNNGAKDVDDFFGVTSVSWHLDCIYYGAGLMTVDKDSNPNVMMKISDDFYSEKAINLCNSLTDWIASSDVWINSSNYGKSFIGNNSIFCIARHRDIAPIARDAGISFGVLPAPKADESQNDYITVLGNPASLYSIYSLSKDKNRAAAVLECWASEAYRTTTPAVFEVTMKMKFVDSPDDAAMYDIIRSSIVFDMGRFFNATISASGVIDVFTSAAVNGDDFSRKASSYKKLFENSLKKIVDSYKKIQSQQ